MSLDLDGGPGGFFLDRCEVCELPFRTRREVEDHIDMGFTPGELDLWAQGRFRFEIPQSSLASHKDHVFLAELYPFMSLKRPEPLTAEERKAHIDSVFPPEIRAAISRMEHTREDDAQV